jgi:hypothetical protein
MEEKASLKELDQWIEQLNECKQLTESQVKTLCDKVSNMKTNIISIRRLLCLSFNSVLKVVFDMYPDLLVLNILIYVYQRLFKTYFVRFFSHIPYKAKYVSVLCCNNV